MKLTVTQENLSKALNLCGRVASTRAGLPVLGNILLRTDKNRLLVAATNLEIAATTAIGAKVSKQGVVTVPAKLITEFVSNLPKEQVEITVTGTQVKITCSGYTSTLNGIAADEFPELPTIDEKTSVQYSLESGDFKQATTQTLFATSNDAVRPVLTGVYWCSFEGNLYLAATDGYRLAERRLVATASDVAAIVPKTTMQEVLRNVHDDIEAVEVLFDETQVRFRIGDSEITSRLIDGKYPDYRKLIPDTTETSAVVEAAELVRTAKIAGLFARQVGGSITVTTNSQDNILSIHSIATEYGENTSTINAQVSGDGTVTLNSRYLTEVMSVFDEPKISFSFSGKLAPIVLRGTKKDASYTYIIMPLRS